VPQRRVPALVLSAVALLGVGCAGEASPRPTAAPTLRPTDPPCPTPKPTSPKWPRDIPEFIPRPPGATIQKVSDTSGGNVAQVRFATPMSLFESRTFLLNELPKAGLVLVRGDAEPAELDVQFQRNEAVHGLYRVFATQERCTTLWLIAVVRNTNAPYDIGYTPPPSSTPLPFG
jgi:hypothetical protein